MGLKILSSFLVLILPFTSWAEGPCYRFLSSNLSTGVSENTAVFSYIARLLDEQIINIDAIKILKQELETGKALSNPVPHKIIGDKVVFTSSLNEIHYGVLAEHLKLLTLNNRPVLRLLGDLIAKDEKISSQRRTVNNQTYKKNVKMEFVPIAPGHFQMYKADTLKRTQVEVPYSFEMMKTVVTQKMWAEVMANNPTYLPNGLRTEEIVVDNKKILIAPDYPVMAFTFWSALVFANKISELNNLKPVYDLSELMFKTTDDEAKDQLMVISGKLKFNAPDNDITKAEGYRLPTAIEQLYVLTDRGRSEGDYFTGLDNKNIFNYAFIPENNPLIEHYACSVAEMPGLLMDGHYFYELYGNVSEVSNDVADLQPDSVRGPNHNKLKKLIASLKRNGEDYGLNSLNARPELARSTRGGVYFDTTYNTVMPMTVRGCGFLETNTRAGQTGFRLVRTLK